MELMFVTFSFRKHEVFFFFNLTIFQIYKEQNLKGSLTVKHRPLLKVEGCWHLRSRNRLHPCRQTHEWCLRRWKSVQPEQNHSKKGLKWQNSHCIYDGRGRRKTPKTAWPLCRCWGSSRVDRNQKWRPSCEAQRPISPQLQGQQGCRDLWLKHRGVLS